MTSLLPLHRIVELSNGWLESLSPSAKDAIQARAHRRTLAPRERLFSRGDEPDGLYCVLEGSVRVSGVSTEGRETLLDFYGPGTWFGEVSVLDGLTRIHSAEGHEDAVLLQICSGDLEALLVAHPTFSRALLRFEALRLRLLLTALEFYSKHPLDRRLASRLLILAGSYGVSVSRGLEIKLHLSQETLAQLIGSTRQRVNQIFQDWERKGIVAQHHGYILLLAQAAMETLAQL